MGINIDWDNLGWDEGDDFIHFAFGDFNSKTFGTNGQLIRTSNGNRFDIHLTPPLNDKVAEVPGGDGSYYFGTQYKPKVIDVSFAFEKLTKNEIQELKRVFSGKELKELAFAEDCIYGGNGVQDYRVYMVKVTNQPQIKFIPFDIDTEELYYGEGTLQFTAYWPFCRGPQRQVNYNTGNQSICENTLLIGGDLPTYINVVVENSSPNLQRIYFKKPSENADKYTLILEGNFASWSSQTGIVKNKMQAIVPYTGNGIITFKHDVDLKLQFQANNGTAVVTYYNWYY